MKIVEFFKKKDDPPQDHRGVESFNDKLRDKTINECSTLYPKDGFRMVWDCGSGWYPIISNLSYEIEALNILYAKYGIVTVVDQVKEKFGTLRFYCTTFIQPPLRYNFLYKFLNAVKNFNKKHFDFNTVTVVDRNEHIVFVVRDLSKEEYSEMSGPYSTNSLFYEAKSSDGNDRYYKITRMDACAETHPKPTKHRLIYHLNKLIEKHASLFDFSRLFVESRKRLVLYKNVRFRTEELVRKAEQECYNVCEECGRSIGDEHSPRCETDGYLRYICEKCAKRLDVPYYKNKELHMGTRRIKDGEDRENPK